VTLEFRKLKKFYYTSTGTGYEEFSSFGYIKV